MSIEELEKILYQNIKDVINIVSYVEKNSIFPYGVISIYNIVENNNFNYDLFEVYFNIDLFDRTKSNINIINTSNIVKNNINKLIGIIKDNSEILNIMFINNELKLYNELNSVWNYKINFKILWKINKN